MRTLRAPSAGPRAVGFAGLIAAALVLAAPAPFELAGQAEAKRSDRPYCTPPSYPVGCIWVPQNAKRPRSVRPQDEPARPRRGDAAGGGVGSDDERERTRGALDWAQGQLKSTDWRYRSERFVEEAFATHGRFASPRSAARRLRLHRSFPAPRGALMLFRPDGFNRGLGHIGLSLGGGRMISALDAVQITNVARNDYWRDLYLGWSRAPHSWPGRIPLPPGLEGAVGAEPVSFLEPGLDETFDTTVHLVARAQSARAVEFSAYYATDPADSSTLAWHHLGRAKDVDGVHVLDWDASNVPSQGNPRFGSVAIAAIAVDGAGRQVGVGDFRRITVLHAGP